MKNKIFATIAMVLMAFALMLTTTGCNGLDPNLLGNVTPSISGTMSPYKAGVIVGEGAWVAYGVCHGNEKYADEIAMAEEIWQKIEAEETVSIGTLNTLALQIGQKALEDKYGYIYAATIILAVNAMGNIADDAVAGNINTDEVNEFLNGVRDGVKRGQSIIPAELLASADKEKKVKVFDCPDGNCTITPGSRNVKYQQRLAQQIIDEGYADPNEVVKEGHNAWQNCKDLVTRCKTLRKYKVEETRCYIHHFTIKDGKLAEIEFHMIGFQNDASWEYVTNCVTCEIYLELENLPDDIEF